MAIGEATVVATVTIHLDDALVRRIEESARREHKSVGEWIKDRVLSGSEAATKIAAMESRALANGYPPGWLALYGSLADDNTFVAPERGKTRSIEGLNGE